MSTENALRFVIKVRNEADLQHHVDALNGDLSALVRLADANDCRFSAQDWIDAVTTLQEAEELTDESLDRVVGGTMGASAIVGASFGDVSARFACFPPIGSIPGGGGGRTLGS